MSSIRFGIIIITLLLVETGAAQSLEKWTEIVFQSQARSGAFKEIRLSQDSIYLSNGNMRNGASKKLQKCLNKKIRRQLNKTLRLLGNVDWKNLKSPTDKRTFDGAAHSQINLKVGNQQFDHYFDDVSPHEKLVPLLTLLLSTEEN